MEHSVVGFAGFIVMILLLAAVGSRLLGVRLSLRRALLTGFPSLVAGFSVGFLVNRRHPGQITPLVVIASVVATMLLTVLAELLARPGARARAGGLPRPWRALRTMAHSTRRYAQLARIAARHGLGGFLGGRRAEPGAPGQLARRLRLALEQAGPIFVKLGQVASTRTDLLPAPVTSELARLQDHVAPVPWPLIQAVIEEELGATIGEVLEDVDPEPLASASLAQAHAARRGGHPVILKVQRPETDKLVTRDLEMIRRLTSRLESRAAWARAYHVAELGRGFADALAEELDFRAEARNIAAIAAAAPADATVLVPTVHADPHPGNVLVLRSGQLALIDFGSVGRLDIRQQAALRRLLVAVAQRDPVELYEAVTELAATPAHDHEQLEQTLTAFMTQHLGPGMTPDAALICDLLAVLGCSGLAFPPVIAGVFRALITLDGTLRTLAPGFDTAAESQAIARRLAGEQFTRNRYATPPLANY